MKGKTGVTLLILASIILIVEEPPDFWIDSGLAALGGLAMVIAAGIIFREIDKAGRK